MRFRMGLMIGMGVGYVAGAAAGRQRYEQIKNRWEQMWNSSSVQPVIQQAKERVVRLQDRSDEVAAGMTGAVEVDTDAVPPQEAFLAAGEIRATGGPLQE